MYRSLARMLALGRRLCRRKQECPEKTHVVEQVTTLPFHITRHRGLNPDRIGEKRVRLPLLNYLLKIGLYGLKLQARPSKYHVDEHECLTRRGSRISDWGARGPRKFCLGIKIGTKMKKKI